MFRKEILIDLKESIRHDDRPVFLENVLDDPEEWATWEDLDHCIRNTGIFDVRYFNKTESKYEDVSVLKIASDQTNEIHKKTTGHYHDRINPVRVIDAPTLLERNHSIIVTNFEHQCEKAVEMIKFLCELFYYDIENHGVWPARISENSGHAHLYAGYKDSNSFSPHVDGPANFIFQIQGENEFTVYENKKCALTEVHMDARASLEYRKEVYDNLRPIETRVMKPGDMVYVPSRQYHYVTPVTDRLSLSFPLILKGPTSVML